MPERMQLHDQRWAKLEALLRSEARRERPALDSRDASSGERGRSRRPVRRGTRRSPQLRGAALQAPTMRPSARAHAAIADCSATSSAERAAPSLPRSTHRSDRLNRGRAPKREGRRKADLFWHRSAARRRSQVAQRRESARLSRAALRATQPRSIPDWRGSPSTSGAARSRVQRTGAKTLFHVKLPRLLAPQLRSLR